MPHSGEHADRVRDLGETCFVGYLAGTRETGASKDGIVVAGSLVEAQGGPVWVLSKMGHGSVVRFTRPTE